MKKIIKNIVGITFLFMGIISGLIPVLQGWVFVLIGYVLLDFKKKELFEEKIMKFLSHFKIGKKLSDLWYKVKKRNEKVIAEDKDKGIKVIYKDIKKIDE